MAFYKLRLVEKIKDKNGYGTYRVKCLNDTKAEVYEMQGIPEIECTSFIISGHFNTARKRGMVTMMRGRPYTYEKANPFKIDRDDLNYMAFELGGEHFPDDLYDALPLSVEIFKQRSEFTKYQMRTMCYYFRHELEEPLRILFDGTRKRIKLLTASRLEEVSKTFCAVPWKACFDKFTRPFGLKEAKIEGLQAYMKMQGIVPLKDFFRRAIRFYTFIRRWHKKMGDDLFLLDDMLDRYVSHPDYGTCDTRDSILEVIDFLSFHGITFIDRLRGLFALPITVRIVSDIMEKLNPSKVEIGEHYDSTKSVGMIIPTLKRQNSTVLPCKPKCELTPEQLAVVQHMLNHRFTFLEGAPGTGKTETLIAAMAEMWLFENHRPMAVTFIGTMVESLQRRFGNRPELANTIHYIYCKVNYSQGDAVRKWISKFDCLIIDEGSNIDIKLFGQLLSVLPPLIRLVIVGDMGQIFPIDPGCPFYDLTLCYQSFRLERNLRVEKDAANLADAANLIRLGRAQEIRFGGGSLEYLQVTEEYTVRSLLEAMVRERIRTLEDTLDFQLVTLRNVDVKMLNKMMEEILFDMGILNRTKEHLYPGKRIVFTKRSKETDLTDSIRNGEMAMVRRVINGTLHLTNGKRVSLSEVDPFSIKTAYCTTSNKAQGSEWNHTVFYVYRKPVVEFTREYAYVAISRARKSCTVIGYDLNDLWNMCSKKARERNSLFRYRLQQDLPRNDDSGQNLVPINYSKFKALPADELAVPFPPAPKDDKKDKKKKNRFT